MEPKPQNKLKLVYVVSEELAKEGLRSATHISSLLPSNKNRSILVHSLASAFGLFKTDPKSGQPGIKPLKPVPATARDLLVYHSRDYVEFVLDPRNSNGEDEAEASSGELNVHFGLEDDCPPFRGLAKYVLLVAGATLTGVKALRDGSADVSICWDGGRHHAQKSRASGFCYVADCVLAVMQLMKPVPVPSSISLPDSDPIHLTQQHKLGRRPRVMYLDLDIHFSDSVSQAFSTPLSNIAPSQVLTLSTHYAAPGFFPASPLNVLPSIPLSSTDGKASRGPPTSFDPFTLSIPLRRGASARTFARIWPIIERVKDAFEPEFVVLQCGLDGLAGDPCATWNWNVGPCEDPGSVSWCVKRVAMDWGCKVLLLGGGGYNSPNAARAWTYITSTLMSRQLSLEADIPDHPPFPLYAPSFTLDVPAGFMPDENDDAYLSEVEACYARVVPFIQEVMSAQAVR